MVFSRITAGVLVLGLTLAGCGAGTSTQAPAASSGSVTIGYASDNEATPLVAEVTRGVQDAAAAAGAQIAVSDNAKDPAKIVDFARQAATTKPSVFIEYNSVADANVRVGQILQQAGIPVLAVQYPIDGAPLFAIDNTEVGRIGGTGLADAAAAKWGKDAPVRALLLALPSGGQPQLERRDGAAAAIRSALPNAGVTEADSKQDPNTARQVTADFLSANPNAKVVVWSHVDSVASAAVAAARAANREGDVLVVGTGGDKSVLPELQRDGSVLVGTVGLFPGDWGKQIVPLAVKIAKGEQVPPVTHPDRIELITAANAGEIAQ